MYNFQHKFNKLAERYKDCYNKIDYLNKSYLNKVI